MERFGHILFVWGKGAKTNMDEHTWATSVQIFTWLALTELCVCVLGWVVGGEGLPVEYEAVVDEAIGQSQTLLENKDTTAACVFFLRKRSTVHFKSLEILIYTLNTEIV